MKQTENIKKYHKRKTENIGLILFTAFIILAILLIMIYVVIGDGTN